MRAFPALWHNPPLSTGRRKERALKTHRLAWILESWVPVILYTGLIFTLSSIPDLAAPGGVRASDKVLHVGEYLIWGLLLRRGLDRVIRAPDGVVAAIAVVTGACLAWLDESFQRTVGRDYSVFDMAADVTGVVLAQIVHDIAVRRHRAGRRDG